MGIIGPGAAKSFSLFGQMGNKMIWAEVDTDDVAN